MIAVCLFLEASAHKTDDYDGDDDDIPYYDSIPTISLDRGFLIETITDVIEKTVIPLIEEKHEELVSETKEAVLNDPALAEMIEKIIKERERIAQMQ